MYVLEKSNEKLIPRNYMICKGYFNFLTSFHKNELQKNDK